MRKQELPTINDDSYDEVEEDDEIGDEASLRNPPNLQEPNTKKHSPPPASASLSDFSVLEDSGEIEHEKGTSFSLPPSLF